MSESLIGLNICGESIDFCDNYILTGSWDSYDQLKLWDIRTYKFICVIDNNKGSYVYSCKFNKNNRKGNFIVTSGSNSNITTLYNKYDIIDEVSLDLSKEEISNNNFDSPDKSSTQMNVNLFKPYASSSYINSPCYKSDFITKYNLIVSAWGDGCIRVYNYKELINE